MKELLELRGIVTVLNTPFTKEDAIHTAGLARNVRNALEAGVAGFLVPALASEVNKLDDHERAQLVETTLETVQGRVPVIGGASAPDRARRVSLARDLITRGCEGILAQIPYENPEQYEAEVRVLADVGPGFLMLQDWDPSGYGLPVPLIARLFEEIPAFRCLKIEVVPAGVKYSEVIRATEGCLHVSGGWAVQQMIEALDRGVHAVMPTAMHRIYCRIYSLYHAGKHESARTLFERLLPVLAFSNQHLDISIHFFKRLLHAQGVYATARIREPILPFDEIHKRIARELIERVIALETETGL